MASFAVPAGPNKFLDGRASVSGLPNFIEVMCFMMGHAACCVIAVSRRGRRLFAGETQAGLRQLSSCHDFVCSDVSN